MPRALAPAAPPPTTRDRLVGAMSDALQRRGLNGIGLNALLAGARAPKGVLYHHFPGGKTELAVAAIQLTAQRMVAMLDKALTRDAAARADPVGALQAWIAGAQKRLGDTGFECGCPLATVALESSADDAELRAALAAGFVAIRGRIADALVAAGHARAKADGVAALIVAAYEGGLLQARVDGSGRPMAQVTATLIQLLEPYRPRGATA